MAVHQSFSRGSAGWMIEIEPAMNSSELRRRSNNKKIRGWGTPFLFTTTWHLIGVATPTFSRRRGVSANR